MYMDRVCVGGRNGRDRRVAWRLEAKSSKEWKDMPDAFGRLGMPRGVLTVRPFVLFWRGGRGCVVTTW